MSLHNFAKTDSLPEPAPRPSGARRARRSCATLAAAWFVLDAVVCLSPPFYWWADGRMSPILGVPAALAYFLAVSACTTASIIFAFLSERAAGEIRA